MAKKHISIHQWAALYHLAGQNIQQLLYAKFTNVVNKACNAITQQKLDFLHQMLKEISLIN